MTFRTLGQLACSMLLALPLLALAGELPDPTRPPQAEATAVRGPVSSPGAAPVLTLQAIVFAAERRSAVINDHSVREGGRIEGARVLRILPGEVIVQRDGHPQHLRLHSEQHQPTLVSSPAPNPAGVPSHD